MPDNIVCHWTKKSDLDLEHWVSDCGHSFCFVGAGPYGQGMKYCPFCGHPLTEQYEEDEDDET